MNALNCLVPSAHHAVPNFPTARNVTIKLTVSKSPSSVRNWSLRSWYSTHRNT